MPWQKQLAPYHSKSAIFQAVPTTTYHCLQKVKNLKDLLVKIMVYMFWETERYKFRWCLSRCSFRNNQEYLNPCHKWRHATDEAPPYKSEIAETSLARLQEPTKNVQNPAILKAQISFTWIMDNDFGLFLKSTQSSQSVMSDSDTAYPHFHFPMAMFYLVSGCGKSQWCGLGLRIKEEAITL